MSGKKPVTPKVPEKEVKSAKEAEKEVKSGSAASSAKVLLKEKNESLKPSPKANESRKPKPPNKLQLEKWTSSINALLSDEDGILAFEAFLEDCETEPGEYKKYLNFYRDCNEYKKKMMEVEAEAQRIYETYLEVGSEFEVGTRGKGEDVGKRLEEEGFPQKNLFNEVQQKAKEVLDEGLYVNFCQHLMEKHKL